MLPIVLNLFVFLNIVYSNEQRTTNIEEMLYKSYVNAVRTAKLINLIHKVEGISQDNVTDEQENAYDTMKLLQKNYDTNKKFKEDASRRQSRLHIIRNPEVLEKYKNHIARKKSEFDINKYSHLEPIDIALEDIEDKGLILVASKNKLANTVENNIKKNNPLILPEKMYLNDFSKNEAKHTNEIVFEETVNSFDTNISTNHSERKTNLRNPNWNNKLNHDKSNSWRKKEKNKNHKMEEDSRSKSGWNDQGYRLVKNIDWDEVPRSDIESRQLKTKYDKTDKKQKHWGQYYNKPKYEGRIDKYKGERIKEQSDSQNKLNIEDKFESKKGETRNNFYSKQFSNKHKLDQQSWNNKNSKSDNWNVKQEKLNKRYDLNKNRDSKNKKMDDLSVLDNVWNKKGFNADKEITQDFNKIASMQAVIENDYNKGNRDLKILKNNSFNKNKYKNSEWGNYNKFKINKLGERNNEFNVYKEENDNKIREIKENWNSYVANVPQEILKKRKTYDSSNRYVEKHDFSFGRTPIPFINKKAIYA